MKICRIWRRKNTVREVKGCFQWLKNSTVLDEGGFPEDEREDHSCLIYPILNTHFVSVQLWTEKEYKEEPV